MAKSVASSISYKVRGMVFLPPNRIIPVIVVPGIMGTNLRAKLKPRSEKEQNEEVKPGEPAWRPPNTMVGGFWDSLSWDRLTPERRQRLFNPDTLEVDDSGPAHIAHGDGRYHVNPVDVRQRWWGELHADSYGALLCGLETRLNEVFTPVSRKDERCIAQHWKDVMAIDPQRWGVRRMKPLTEAELEKHARFHFPVYACGYNWLESCGKSSQRLEQRILQIIEYWKGMKKKCEQVILVTHSMGGLVARACAKRIPDQIAGVIHGVMPALGAPAAYRRLACGTEAPNFVASRIAKILGTTTYHTTPVLATSPGALELLPNHLYPRPWLHVRVMYPGGPPDAPETAFDYLHLPNAVAPNPYDLYRDMRRWYRLIDPELADPTGRFEDVPGGVIETIKTAVETAEQFHMKELGDYYHPNTYAFYGDDSRQLSFGQVRWVGRKESSAHVVFTPANVASATPMVTYGEEGARLVLVEHDTVVLFKPEPADTRGDGTVPHQSGAGPADKVRRLFETRGYDHQGSYNNDDMLALTLRLIVKIVQGMP
ncbi:esterase/lipase family protein [Massilia horti]|uniref:esterase/lipase family protein n=1 Tax=Massilia horti TaxID=2562153 RepID=UPI001E4E5EA8|nr:GPI inositol-deacylase [Massilia horti]